MVLLTSSAVSAVISGGVVCIFTFLLFMSGYVLQQRTVRSLQEALRNPPEQQKFPTPTLPPQFQQLDENTSSFIDLEGLSLNEKDQTVLSGGGARSRIQISTTTVAKDSSLISEQVALKMLWYDYLQSPKSADSTDILSDALQYRSSDADSQHTSQSNPPESLAYILVLPEPIDLCSAALFTTSQRRYTQLDMKPSIVWIYPATWETSDDEVHNSALELLRDMQDHHEVIMHPVSISRIWAGVKVESQLLAELQRTRWQFDRALYVRSPGMALDVPSLDTALANSEIKKSWQQINSKTTTNQPSLLFYAAEKGLLAPNDNMRTLAVNASMSNPVLEPETLSAYESAAYLVFDEGEMAYLSNQADSLDGLFGRFEQDRRKACAGTSLFGNS